MEHLGGKIDRRLLQNIVSDRKKVGAKVTSEDPAEFQFTIISNLEPKSGRWARTKLPSDATRRLITRSGVEQSAPEVFFASV